MVEKQISSTGAVDDYLTSLLFDTQITPQQDESEEPILRFAKVDQGFELVCLWHKPGSFSQRVQADLFLLSCTQQLAPSRLRRAMLQSVSFACG